MGLMQAGCSLIVNFLDGILNAVLGGDDPTVINNTTVMYVIFGGCAAADIVMVYMGMYLDVVALAMPWVLAAGAVTAFSFLECAAKSKMGLLGLPWCIMKRVLSISFFTATSIMKALCKILPSFP